MSIALLSTEQAPPISVPLRFFAAAPLFLLLAALSLATGTGDPFTDTRSPALLAATHCITLGFLTLVMMGAIQQIMPVVIGSPMPAYTVRYTFLPMLAGTLSLSAGFLLNNPALFNAAWLLLGFAGLVFVGSCLISLARAGAKNPTKIALLLSVISFAATLALGALLARGYAVGLPLDYSKLAASHVSLGLGGWVMMLIAGVSYQVVPMFQLTPNYPRWVTASLTPILFFSLLANIATHWLDAPTLASMSTGVFCAAVLCFALITLRLQTLRRRRVADATLSFFRSAMLSLLCAALLTLAAIYSPLQDYFHILAVVIFVLGFALAVIFGMLYKIVPFLVWFHLFRGGAKKGVPNIKEIIPEIWLWRHLWLHRCTVLAALLASVWPPALWLIIAGLSLQGLLLGYTLHTGINVYRRTLRRLAT